MLNKFSVDLNYVFMFILEFCFHFRYARICPLFKNKPVKIHIDFIDVLVVEILILTEHTETQEV